MVHSLVVMVTLIITIMDLHHPSGTMLMAPGRLKKAQNSRTLLQKLMMLLLLKMIALAVQVPVTKRMSNAPKDVDMDVVAAGSATAVAVLVRSVDMVQGTIHLLLSLLTLLAVEAAFQATVEVLAVMDGTLADGEATSTARLRS